MARIDADLIPGEPQAANRNLQYYPLLSVSFFFSHLFVLFLRCLLLNVQHCRLHPPTSPLTSFSLSHFLGILRSVWSAFRPPHNQAEVDLRWRCGERQSKAGRRVAIETLLGKLSTGNGNCLLRRCLSVYGVHSTPFIVFLLTVNREPGGLRAARHTIQSEPVVLMMWLCLKTVISK